MWATSSQFIFLSLKNAGGQMKPHHPLVVKTFIAISSIYYSSWLSYNSVSVGVIASKKLKHLNLNFCGLFFCLSNLFFNNVEAIVIEGYQCQIIMYAFSQRVNRWDGYFKTFEEWIWILQWGWLYLFVLKKSLVFHYAWLSQFLFLVITSPTLEKNPLT